MENKKNILTESLKNLGIYDGDVIWVRDIYDNEMYYQLKNDRLIMIDTLKSDEAPITTSNEEMSAEDIGALVTGLYDYEIIARGSGYINNSIIQDFDTNQNELASCLDNKLNQIKKSIKEIEEHNQYTKNRDRIEGIISISICGGFFFVLLLCLIFGL